MRISLKVAAAVTGLLITGCSPTTDRNASAADPSTSSNTPSPEADRILVTGSEGSVSIVVRGGDSVELYAPSAALFSIQPTPSPDGTIIIHTGRGEDGAVVAIAWSEDGRSEIDFGFVPFFYAWNADGTMVAALGNDGTLVAGAVADLRRTAVEEIGLGAPHFLAWSPDGKRIANHRDGRHIDVVALDGSVRAISQTPAIFQAPEWLSNTELVVATQGSSLQASLAATTASTARLVVVSEDGSARDLLELDAVSQFDLDPSGSRLAVFDGPPGDGRMRIYDIVSGDVSPVDAPNAVGFEWSPDGNRLLTWSFRGGRLQPEVWRSDGTLEHSFGPITPTATFVSEYLPFWGQYVRTVRTWSPRSDAFVFAARTAEEDVIHIQNLNADRPQRLAPGSMAQWLP